MFENIINHGRFKISFIYRLGGRLEFRNQKNKI